MVFTVVTVGRFFSTRGDKNFYVGTMVFTVGIMVFTVGIMVFTRGDSGFYSARKC